MHIRRSIEYSWQSIRIRIRIRSNEEITIRILWLSVKIADIRKISIHGHTSAHLWSVIVRLQRSAGGVLVVPAELVDEGAGRG